ncbi:hypothetical protein MRB53_006010 [Persea americana]|uniref:Uncharacterized protein n=1 Tax=Persea americana TaxID=3435 RepID=A0ACC2MER5_PERAE|nr:hypothetical protein MRB53_006010 [Persea americana]
MMRNEMNINEEEGVQRSIDKIMDKRENGEEEEEEEEMRVEKPKSSTAEELKEEERRLMENHGAFRITQMQMYFAMRNE